MYCIVLIFRKIITIIRISVEKKGLRDGLNRNTYTKHCFSAQDGRAHDP
jgi:hypothetical protein